MYDYLFKHGLTNTDENLRKSPAGLGLQIDKFNRDFNAETHKVHLYASQMLRVARSGSLHSTKLSRLTHAQLSPHISDLVTTTVLGSSRRSGSTYAISTG